MSQGILLLIYDPFSFQTILSERVVKHTKYSPAVPGREIRQKDKEIIEEEEDEDNEAEPVATLLPFRQQQQQLDGAKKVGCNK